MTVSRRLVRLFFGMAALAVVVFVVLRVPSALHDFTRAVSHFRVSRLPWLAVGLVAEAVSFGFLALLERRLLRAEGVKLRPSELLGLSVAATSITDVVPGGAAPATVWLTAQYRDRGAAVEAALWTVLASGFTATVAILSLLLIGAGSAGVGSPAVLVGAGAVLVFGSAGFVALVHRADRLEGFLARRYPGRFSLVKKAAARARTMAEVRIGFAGGAEAFAFATANWLCDAVTLVAAFELLGLPVPWSALLFGYAAAQVAGGLVPLPGGLGAAEGGLVGALSITGTEAGKALVVALVYRVMSYWIVVGVGGGVLLGYTHRHLPGSSQLPGDLRKDEKRLPRSSPSG